MRLVVVVRIIVTCCCCISYQLAPMLTPTFVPCVLTFVPCADLCTLCPDLCTLCPDPCTMCPDLCTLCPDLCTLCPDLCSLYFPYLNWYKHSIAHMVASCYLLGAAITFSHCMFQIIHLIAHVVISPTAICTGGNFSSSHWCYYCTATYATCTVWYIRLAIYEQHAPMVDEATTLA